jgi:NADH:ubiquinone oxidoreductase subunit F (NADH-binding)
VTGPVITAPDPASPRPGPGAGELPRLLPGDDAGLPASLAGHLARHGARPSCGGDALRKRELINEVERAGLTGRGGAAFPTAVKLRALAAARAAPAVIANGVEGEPASAKDKTLLACAPHLVLDGAACAAELTGAEQAVIVVHHAVRAIVGRAARERQRAGCDPVPVRVMTAADRFTAGEASALVHWVQRGVPTPTGQPPRVGGPGRAARPSLVQNVETLAHLALIMRHGAPWFRSAGTAAEPGTMLVTLAGAVRHPGVYEIPIGTPVSGLLELAAGASAPLGALLLGGYFGTWAEPAVALALPFSSAALATIGASPGAGVVVALPRTTCGLAETARVTRYLASASAGQCGPCVFGLDAIASQLEHLASGGACHLGTVQRWLTQVAGRGACRHPDGTARMVSSALHVFRAEIDRHGRGWCVAEGTSGMLPVPDVAQP